MCDEAVWSHQKQHLSELADIVIPDFRGFDSLQIMAEYVLQQAPPNFALAGHSMGGRVALEIVNMAPERVQRLALVETGAYPLVPGEAQARQALVDLAREGGIQAVAENWIKAMVHPDRQSDQVLFESIRVMLLRTSVDDFIRQVHALLTRLDAIPYLENISCRTLVIAGQHDTLYTVAQTEQMLTRLQNAYLKILDAGHMATMEIPEQVTKCLAEWLAAPE